MRRSQLTVTLFVLMFAIPTVVQSQPQPVAPESVIEILQQAIMVERSAQARSEAFAERAAAEGYLGAANLFRSAAAAERIHEQMFASLLAKRKGAAVESIAEARAVGTTAENLRVAMKAERLERDVTYHDMMAQCQTLGDSEAATTLDTARTAESEHANLLMAASWNLDGMKTKKTYWVCSACGFTSEVRLSRCPSCRKESGKMKAIE